MRPEALRLPRTLAWRLLLAILPAVAAGVVGAVWLQHELTRRQMLAGIHRAVRDAAGGTAAQIDGLLRQRADDLLTVADTPLIADYYRNVDYQLLDEASSYRQELERYLLKFARRAGVYSSIRYLDARGREVCAVEGGAVRPADPRRPAPSFFPILARLRGQAYWTSDARAEPGGRVVMYLGKPVRDETGALKGAVVLAYDLSELRRALGASLIGRQGTAFLETAAGPFPPGAGLPAGVSGITARRPLSQKPWSVVVQASADELLAPLERIRDEGLLAAAAATVALVVLLLWLVRSITRPVARLVDAARRIGRGDLGHRIASASSDELGTLSQAFDEMAESLERNRKQNAELQSQLVQAEKLSAVGQLISAVAHELNNPLAAVCAYAQVALMEGVPPQLKDDLGHVHHNALRCRKVVDNLLFFVRKSRQEKRLLDINAAAASALELLDYRLLKTEDVAVEQSLDPRLPRVIGDFQQLVQVLVNLINNACDAMDQQARYPEDKRLRIATRPAAGSVELSVEDNGPGVPDEIRARVFEPFVTTKEPGRGTGLGLSICRQILADHGGEISFRDREGGGTVFTLRLPVPSGEELLALELPAPVPELPAVPGRSVLVVDDEPELADVVARVLREDGDRVEVAVEGERALALVRERAFDLVVADFEMERVKGDELYQALCEARPKDRPRILFVTGDLLNPKVLRFLERTKSPYLAKPFDVAELRQAARRLLSAETQGGPRIS